MKPDNKTKNQHSHDRHSPTPSLLPDRVEEPRKEDNELAEYEKQQREKQAKRRIDRKIREEDARQRIIDKIKQAEEIRRAFQEQLDNLKQEYGDLNSLSAEKFAEYTQLRENLEDKMYEMLDSDGDD